MKLTIYCDKDLVLRYSPNGWENFPDFCFRNDEYAKKAKSESIPFEEQEQIKIIIDKQIRFPCNCLSHDSFCELEIDGEIEVGPCNECLKEQYPDSCDKKVARIVPRKNEAQTSNPNKPNYLSSTNLITDGMPREWIELWQQIEIWYGDISQRETGEQLLKRLQGQFKIVRK